MIWGHLAGWPATEVFGIELAASAVEVGIDGRFMTEPLRGRTVKVMVARLEAHEVRHRRVTGESEINDRRHACRVRQANGVTISDSAPPHELTRASHGDLERVVWTHLVEQPAQTVKEGCKQTRGRAPCTRCAKVRLP